MKISITGRHVTVSDNLKDYAEKKIGKLDKYFNQLIDSKVIFYEEKMDKYAELLIFGDGVKFYGKEKGGDFYSCSDLISDKLEEQIKRYKNRHQEHKGIPLSDLPIVDISSDNLSIAINEISIKPKDPVEAYLEMKLENSDYILFTKANNDLSASNYQTRLVSVIYKEKNDIKMAELSLEHLKKDKYVIDEFDLIINSDSPANPDIKFVQLNTNNVNSLEVQDALSILFESDKQFLPFFNKETSFINVISKTGKNLVIDVPGSN